MEAQTQHRSARLTNAQRYAILADHAAGMTGREIAKKFDRHPSCITRLIKDIRTSVPPASTANSSIADLKAGMVQPAARAIHRGMACDDDVYKAANIGVSVLKGIGVFSDGPQTNIQALIMQTPADMRDAFLDACCYPPLLGESKSDS